MTTLITSAEPKGGALSLGWVRSLLGDTIPAKTLALFFDSLAILLHTGMSLPEALTRASVGSDPELRRICETVAPALQAGAPLTASLARDAARFPPLVMPLLEVGEMSGGMAGTARRLADNFHQTAAVERRFKTQIFSPWLIILALGLLRAILSVGQPLPEIIRGTAGTLLTFTFWYLGGRIAVRAAMAWPWLRLSVDTIKVALPRLGLVVRNLAAARWARSFATLWDAGVPISPALEVASRSALNAYYERAIQQAARQTRLGRSLHESLGSTQLLPAHLLSVIATAETSGNLAANLERLAAVMEEEALARASQEMMTFVVAGEILIAIIAVSTILH